MPGHRADLGVKIRELQSVDEARKCARFMANSEPWVTLSRGYDDSIKILTDPTREVYLAIVEQETVGFVILRMTGAFVGYIQTVGVIAEWRNRGIGTNLIRFAEKRIFSETPNAFICVSSFNRGAERLYKRLGYKVVGVLADYIVTGHSETLLRKTIAPLSEFRNSRQ